LCCLFSVIPALIGLPVFPINFFLHWCGMLHMQLFVSWITFLGLVYTNTFHSTVCDLNAVRTPNSFTILSHLSSLSYYVTMLFIAQFSTSHSYFPHLMPRQGPEHCPSLKAKSKSFELQESCWSPCSGCLAVQSHCALNQTWYLCLHRWQMKSHLL
jgi:hypothetical protein